MTRPDRASGLEGLLAQPANPNLALLDARGHLVSSLRKDNNVHPDSALYRAATPRS